MPSHRQAFLTPRGGGKSDPLDGLTCPPEGTQAGVPPGGQVRPSYGYHMSEIEH